MPVSGFPKVIAISRNDVSLRPLVNEVAADAEPGRGSEVFGATSGAAVKFQSNHSPFSHPTTFYIGIGNGLKFSLKAHNPRGFRPCDMELACTFPKILDARSPRSVDTLLKRSDSLAS
jgi:hypothetical protein